MIGQCQPRVRSFNVSGSGQCGMVGWRIGILGLHVLLPVFLHLPGEAAEEGRVKEEMVAKRWREGKGQCCSVSLNLNTGAPTLLACSRCPYHSQRWTMDRPFHISHTLRCHFNIILVASRPIRLNPSLCLASSLLLDLLPVPGAGNGFCYQRDPASVKSIYSGQMGQNMLQPQVLCLCSIILTLFFTLLQPTAAQITAPWEVDALKAIRGSLIDPHGNLSSWNRGDPCMGNWSHVICYNATGSDGYFHVKELQLLSLNLSGILAPELGQLSQMKIMDFMWNSIGGTIPKEVGNITSLELMLLNGNQLNGSLPEEIGFLPNLNRIQIDQNHISGLIPKSFANLNKTKHFHMNNNSLSGQIPPELSRLPSLVHLLLDNNNLSGYIPPELSKLPNVLIIQLDNNNFSGSTIPSSYGNISTLLKLSLRNCSLEGPVPDVSGIPQLGYLDVSWNQLRGPIPSIQFSSNITTIDLSHNNLNGSIPGIFSGLPYLQRLSLDDNNLTGSVPSNIWQDIDLRGNKSLVLDFQNNALNNLSTPLSPPPNVTILYAFYSMCFSLFHKTLTH
ncbi:Leucine-rich repeat protein kinase family protein [Zea mays]|uniref:non-specific serine/threonine protein kinase n=1 Tax=Zea mays TaxID=4577 RepID=A0A1D6EG85_MAIZE|nr:Leucine-rich repeat protein kinase family protein [Zea mays]ONM19182.1 Leucine-rich repeat protein kinase family protein [Zea mays]